MLLFYQHNFKLLLFFIIAMLTKYQWYSSWFFTNTIFVDKIPMKWMLIFYIDVFLHTHRFYKSYSKAMKFQPFRLWNTFLRVSWTPHCLFVTYFHKFWIYESMIFSTKNVLFFLRSDNASFFVASFFVNIYSLSNIFELNRKIEIPPCFKRKQEKICGKKSWIHNFEIHENMSWTCYYIQEIPA